jgi:hypothetical protein
VGSTQRGKHPAGAQLVSCTCRCPAHTCEASMHGLLLCTSSQHAQLSSSRSCSCTPTQSCCCTAAAPYRLSYTAGLVRVLLWCLCAWCRQNEACAGLGLLAEHWHGVWSSKARHGTSLHTCHVASAQCGCTRGGSCSTGCQQQEVAVLSPAHAHAALTCLYVVCISTHVHAAVWTASLVSQRLCFSPAHMHMRQAGWCSPVSCACMSGQGWLSVQLSCLESLLFCTSTHAHASNIAMYSGLWKFIAKAGTWRPEVDPSLQHSCLWSLSCSTSTHAHKASKALLLACGVVHTRHGQTWPSRSIDVVNLMLSCTSTHAHTASMPQTVVCGPRCHGKPERFLDLDAMA